MKSTKTILLVIFALVVGLASGSYADRNLLGYNKTQLDVELVLLQGRKNRDAAREKTIKDVYDGKASMVAACQNHLVETNYAVLDPKTGNFRMRTFQEISALNAASASSAAPEGEPIAVK